MAAFNLTAEINLRGPSNLNKVVADIRRQLSSVSLDLKINPSASRGIQAVTSDVKQLSVALKEAQTNAVALGGALRGIGASVRNINSVSGGLNSIVSSSKGASGAIKQASTEMAEFGKQSALAVRRFAAFSVATGAIYAVSKAITSAYGEFINFNREFVRLQQVTNSSATGLSSLSQEITKLSTGLGVSSSELLKVSTTLAQAGLSASETKRALEALAKSALAPSFGDLNQTVEGSIALMRQFGISAGDLDKALGSINAVAAKFAVEADDIITAIQRTGGVFANASKGVSEGKDALNEFLAVFTSVRATTRESAETIATGLRTIFTRIQRGGTIEALKEFGVNLTDLEGKFVGPYEAVRRLSEGLKRLDPRDLRFSQIVEELGGFRQIGKVIPLIQQFTTAQQALSVAQRGAGSLAQDAATAQNALGVQITKVREQFVALIRDIGQSDSFQTFADVSLKLASALISVADAAKNVLPALAAIAAVKSIGGISQFVGGFTGGIKRKNQGGPIQAFARGGLVPGYGDGDTIPAMLSPGEFVIRKKAVQTIGVSNLHKINKYGSGGLTKKEDFSHLDAGPDVYRKGSYYGKGLSAIGIMLPSSWNQAWAQPGKLKLPGSELRNYIQNTSVEQLFARQIGKMIDGRAHSGRTGSFRGGRSNPLYEQFTNPQSLEMIKKNILNSINVNSIYSSNADLYPLGKAMLSAANEISSKLPKELSRVRKVQLPSGKYGTITAKNSDISLRLSEERDPRRIFNQGYRRSSGGGIPGGEDTVPAMLTPGEFVINKQAAQKIGMSQLYKLNNADKIRGYNKGGYVGFADGGLAARQTTNIGASTISVDSGTIAALKDMASALEKLGLSASESAKLIESGGAISVRQAEKAYQADLNRAKIAGASANDIYAIELKLAEIRKANASKISTSKEFAGFSGQRLQQLEFSAQNEKEVLTQRLRMKGYNEEEIAANQDKIRGRAYENVAATALGTTRKDLASKGLTGESIEKYINQSMMDRKTLAQMDKTFITQRQQEIYSQLASEKVASGAAVNKKELASQALAAAKQEASDRKKIVQQLRADMGLAGAQRGRFADTGQNLLASFGMGQFSEKGKLGQSLNRLSQFGQQASLGLTFAGGLIGENVGKAIGGKEGKAYGEATSSFVSSIGIGAMFGPVGILTGAFVGLTSAMKTYKESLLNSKIEEIQKKLEASTDKVQKSFERLTKTTDITIQRQEITNVAKEFSGQASSFKSSAGFQVSSMVNRGNFGTLRGIGTGLLDLVTGGTFAGGYERGTNRRLSFNTSEATRAVRTTAEQTGLNQNVPQFIEKSLRSGLNIQQTIQKLGQFGNLADIKETIGAARSPRVAEMIARRSEAVATGDIKTALATNEQITKAVNEIFNNLLKETTSMIDAENNAAAASRQASIQINLFSESLQNMSSGLSKANAESEDSLRSIGEKLSGAGTGRMGYGGPSRLNENILSNMRGYSEAQITDTIRSVGQQYKFNPQFTEQAVNAGKTQKILTDELPKILAEVAAKSGGMGVEGDSAQTQISKKLLEVLKTAGVADPAKVVENLMNKINAKLSAQGANRQGVTVADLAQDEEAIAKILQGTGVALEEFQKLIEASNKQIDIFVKNVSEAAEKQFKGQELQIQAQNIRISATNQLAQTLGKSISPEMANKEFNNMIIGLTTQRNDNGRIIRGPTDDPAEILRRKSESDQRIADLRKQFETESRQPGGINPERARAFADAIKKAEIESLKLGEAHKRLQSDSTRAANVLARISQLKEQEGARRGTFDELIQNANNPEWMQSFIKEVDAFTRVMSGEKVSLDQFSLAMKAFGRREQAIDPSQAKAERDFIYQRFIGQTTGNNPQIMQQLAPLLGIGNNQVPEMDQRIAEFERFTNIQVSAVQQEGEAFINAAKTAAAEIVSAGQNFNATVSGGGQQNPIAEIPQGRYNGGLIYARKGRYIDFKPQGTDTVPAMLSPGEFVVNAKSAQQNLGLLHAINNSSKTSGFSKGGIVYLARGGSVSGFEAMKPDYEAIQKYLDFIETNKELIDSGKISEDPQLNNEYLILQAAYEREQDRQIAYNEAKASEDFRGETKVSLVDSKGNPIPGTERTYKKETSTDGARLSYSERRKRATNNVANIERISATPFGGAPTPPKEPQRGASPQEIANYRRDLAKYNQESRRYESERAKQRIKLNAAIKRGEITPEAAQSIYNQGVTPEQIDRINKVEQENLEYADAVAWYKNKTGSDFVDPDPKKRKEILKKYRDFQNGVPETREERIALEREKQRKSEEFARKRKESEKPDWEIIAERQANLERIERETQAKIDRKKNPELYDQYGRKKTDIQPQPQSKPESDQEFWDRMSRERREREARYAEESEQRLQKEKQELEEIRKRDRESLSSTEDRRAKDQAAQNTINPLTGKTYRDSYERESVERRLKRDYPGMTPLQISQKVKKEKAERDARDKKRADEMRKTGELYTKKDSRSVQEIDAQVRSQREKATEESKVYRRSELRGKKLSAETAREAAIERARSRKFKRELSGADNPRILGIPIKTSVIDQTLDEANQIGEFGEYLFPEIEKRNGVAVQESVAYAASKALGRSTFNFAESSINAFFDPTTYVLLPLAGAFGLAPKGGFAPPKKPPNIRFKAGVSNRGTPIQRTPSGVSTTASTSQPLSTLNNTVNRGEEFSGFGYLFPNASLEAQGVSTIPWWARTPGMGAGPSSRGLGISTTGTTGYNPSYFPRQQGTGTVLARPATRPPAAPSPSAPTPRPSVKTTGSSSRPQGFPATPEEAARLSKESLEKAQQAAAEAQRKMATMQQRSTPSKTPDKPSGTSTTPPQKPRSELKLRDIEEAVKEADKLPRIKTSGKSSPTTPTKETPVTAEQIKQMLDSERRARTARLLLYGGGGAGIYFGADRYLNGPPMNGDVSSKPSIDQIEAAADSIISGNATRDEVASLFPSSMPDIDAAIDRKKGKPRYNYRGGPIYAARGQLIPYMPRGTDTVPAMLTPGEFVVNKQAAAKNLPLLKAINNNSQTQGLSRGGPVQYFDRGGGVGSLISGAASAIAGVLNIDTSGLESAFKEFGNLTNGLSPIASALGEAVSSLTQAFTPLSSLPDAAGALSVAAGSLQGASGGLGSAIGNFSSLLNGFTSKLSELPKEITLKAEGSIPININVTVNGGEGLGDKLSVFSEEIYSKIAERISDETRGGINIKTNITKGK